MAKIVGVEVVKYVSKKTNLPVEGYRLHLTEPINPNDGFGDKVETVFFSKEAVKNLIPSDDYVTDAFGRDVRVLYNKYGRPAELMVFEN